MERNQTNFDKYLERKLADPGFREQFAAADRAWDTALQRVALRRARGLTREQAAEPDPAASATQKDAGG